MVLVIVWDSGNGGYATTTLESAIQEFSCDGKEYYFGELIFTAKNLASLASHARLLQCLQNLEMCQRSPHQRFYLNFRWQCFEKT